MFKMILSTHFVSCFPNPVTMELEVTTLYPSLSSAFRICKNQIFKSGYFGSILQFDIKQFIGIVFTT